MAFVSDFIASLIPELGLVAIVATFALLVVYVASFSPRLRARLEGVNRWVSRNAVLLIFLAAFASMSGSLFYSNVRGLTPCMLCWFQRILIYPLVLIFGLELVIRKRDAIRYGLVLAVPGFLIALWQYIEQTFHIAGACSPTVPGQEAVSCSARYVFAHGFISIPFMALTAFVFIVVVSLVAFREDAVARGHR